MTLFLTFLGLLLFLVVPWYLAGVWRDLALFMGVATVAFTWMEAVTSRAERIYYARAAAHEVEPEPELPDEWEGVPGWFIRWYIGQSQGETLYPFRELSDTDNQRDNAIRLVFHMARRGWCEKPRSGVATKWIDRDGAIATLSPILEKGMQSARRTVETPPRGYEAVSGGGVGGLE